MGIALKDLLKLDYFKDFRVIAGQKGINREIQGVAVMDAPDAMRWSKGRELIMTSGYSISIDPDCISRAFEEGFLQFSSGLMIKEGRYFEKIPQAVIDVCEEHDFPLIRMPYEIPFMDVMNELNIAVLNRTIRRFRIEHSSALQFSNLTYKEQKIKKILKAVESEMDFPGAVYDISDQKSYYSSANFKRITESFQLRESDYYCPPQECTEYVLCDYIHMKRYRLIHKENPDGPRISWVLIPITAASEIKAYFIVMESKEFLDYFDEYSIRIAFLMLQSVYEQITLMQSMGNVGFENLVLYALNSEDNNPKRLLNQAYQQGISADSTFLCVRFRQRNQSVTAREKRTAFLQAFHSCRLSENSRLAFTDENEGIILIEVQKAQMPLFPHIQEQLMDFRKEIEGKCPEMKIEFGIFFQPRGLTELKETVRKCDKAIDIGSILLPDAIIWDYEKLGALAWLDIPEDEFEQSMKQYRTLLTDPKNVELLKTLKIYLENNMNYSITAEKMFLHINTIRKRIDKIDSLLDIQWDDYISRLKVDIVLQFLNLEDKKA